MLLAATGEGSATPDDFVVTEVMPGIFYFGFKTQKSLTLSFSRLQEFYESALPQLHGKYFEWSTFIDIQMNNRGNINYFSKWSGFNVPGHVIMRFIDLFSHNLTRREEKFLGSVLEHTQNVDNFYIIASRYSRKDESDVIAHEVAHGLYYLNSTYKQLMDTICEPVLDDFKDFLKDMKYNSNVFMDELQAYLGTSDAKYMKKHFDCDAADFAKEIKEAHLVFESFSSGFSAPQNPNKRRLLKL